MIFECIDEAAREERVEGGMEGRGREQTREGADAGGSGRGRERGKDIMTKGGDGTDIQ